MQVLLIRIQQGKQHALTEYHVPNSDNLEHPCKCRHVIGKVKHKKRTAQNT
jgi:hypothetical protein